MNTVRDQEQASAEFQDSGPLRFERRSTERWPMGGAATAFGLEGEHFGIMHEMTMCDCSHGGIAAISDDPIHPGTVVSIGFQQPGMIARRGVVRRCEPCGEGYRVGIEYQMRQAA